MRGENLTWAIIRINFQSGGKAMMWRSLNSSRADPLGAYSHMWLWIQGPLLVPLALGSAGRIQLCNLLHRVCTLWCPSIYACLYMLADNTMYWVTSALLHAKNGLCSSQWIRNGTYKLKLLGEDGWVRRNIARSHGDFRANKKKDESILNKPDIHLSSE